MSNIIQGMTEIDEGAANPEDGWGSRRHTAYHEAGHAVAALAFGRGVSEVTIIPGEGYAGQIAYTGAGVVNPFPFEDTAMRMILVSAVAGGIAAALSRVPDEQRPFVEVPFVDDGTDGDRYLVLDLGSSLWGWRDDGDYGAEWDELVAQTRELILANWRAVESVAGALLRHGTLDQEMLLAAVKARSSHV